MIQTFFVPGPLPSLNEIISAAKGYQGRGFAYSKMKEEWTALVVERIQKTGIKPVGKVVILCEWREKNKKRDPDNVVCGAKFVLDGLVKAGILENDGWEQVVGFSHRWVVNKDYPGVHVEIEEVT